MALFRDNPNVSSIPHAKRIIRTFNNLAAALVQFEDVW
jgi:hypothetical protein